MANHGHQQHHRMMVRDFRTRLFVIVGPSPPVLALSGLQYSIARMATVITCPHALGLLIRNRPAFENTRRVTTVVFDKTGTLTEGSFAVTSVKTHSRAQIGVAVGSGTDIAAETADIILVNSNPLYITALIPFGRATYRKILRNLVWATGYNVVAINARLLRAERPSG